MRSSLFRDLLLVKVGFLFCCSVGVQAHGVVQRQDQSRGALRDSGRSDHSWIMDQQVALTKPESLAQVVTEPLEEGGALSESPILLQCCQSCFVFRSQGSRSSTHSASSGYGGRDSELMPPPKDLPPQRKRNKKSRQDPATR